MSSAPLSKPAPNYSIDPVTGNRLIQPRKRLLERSEKTVPRVAALDCLQERLAIATELHQHESDGGRAGVYRAMCALVEYLTSQGIPHATLEPITAVMAAIVDADKGISSTIFRPVRSKKGGSPPKLLALLGYEGQLATVLECCILHCKAEGQWPYLAPGAKMAANLINASEWPMKKTASELIEIRERIMQGAKDSPDRILVDFALESEVAKANPLIWAKLLLSHEWVMFPPKESA